MRNTISISIIISLFLKVIFTFSLIYFEIAKNTGNIILGITKNSNDILIYLSAFLSMMMTVLIWYNLFKGNRKMEKISEGMYEFAKTSFDMYMMRKQKNRILIIILLITTIITLITIMIINFLKTLINDINGIIS